MIPPSSSNILFVVIMLLFYYSLGSSLERTWGAFRYNVYILSGMLFTVIGAFILYLILGPASIVYAPAIFHILYQSVYFSGFCSQLSGYAGAVMMIIPIKIKWLAWLDAAYILYDLVRGNWATRTVIIASLLNFIIFFLGTRNFSRISPKRYTGGSSSRRLYTLRWRRGSPSINARCAEEQKKTETIWSSASAQNATETMNIVRITCLPINI